MGKEVSMSLSRDIVAKTGLSERFKAIPATLCIAYILILLISSTCFGDVISDLVPIVIMAESSGNPNASDGQSFGLMGISPCVLEDFNNDKTKPYPYIVYFGELQYPKINKMVGTWYLRKIQSWLPEQYKNSKAHIVAAYNWGIGNLKKNGWKIPKSFKNHPNKIYRKVFRGEL